MSNFFERLMHVARNHGINNPNELAEALQYKSPEKLYRLSRDKNANPSFSILHDISNLFEDCDMRWMITGHYTKNIGSEKANTPVAYNKNLGPIPSFNEPTPRAKRPYLTTPVPPTIEGFVPPTVPPTHESCKICEEKERVITQQQERIRELKDHIEMLEVNIEQLGGRTKKQVG